MLHSVNRFAVRGALLAGTALAIMPQGATARDASEPTSSGVEEIIVTAQKREQSLQDVPVSVTALTEAALAANRIQDVRDLSAVVPSLTVRPSAGGSMLPNYSMRGIFTGGAAIGTDRGIALYIDGVYIQNAQGSIFQVADVERIEVLKGPQGTLFGRNATGGAVSLVTRNPTGEFGVKQDLTYGNFSQFRSKTRIDLPRFGPISASVTYLHSERKGDTRNLGAGTVWDYGPATGGEVGKRTSPKTLGDENVDGILAAVKFDFHPDLDLVYKFDYTDNHYTPEAVGVSYLPQGSFLSALYNLQPAALRTPITDKRPDAVNNAYTVPGLSKSQGHNLTARFQISDDIAIKNIFSMRKSSTLTAQDFEGVGGLTNSVVQIAPGFNAPPAWLPGGNPGPQCLVAVPSATCLQSIGKPFTFLSNAGSNREQQWSNEVQVNIVTQWFALTAGYLHFHNKQTSGGGGGTFNTSLLTAHYGQGTSAAGTAFVIPGNPGNDDSVVTTDSDAFYLQPEIHITDQIDVIAGARITNDRKKGFEYFPDSRARTLAGLPLTSPIRYKSSEASYLIGLNFRPTDNILTYVKYSTGYISGGSLATIDFEPETAKSFEGGIKADLFDRRLRSNLAVYHAKYGKIQYATSGTLTGVPAARQFAVGLVPSADATAYGFEWENTLVPVDGLTFTANVGYLHFKFDQTSVFPGFANQAGVPGYQRFTRPKWTGNLSAQYATPQVALGGHLVFRVDASFTSRNLLTSDVSPLNANDPTRPLFDPTSAVIPFNAVVEDPALRAAATVPFQWIVNARVAFADFDIAGSKAQLAVWGRNLFDADNLAQFVSLGPVGSAIYERQRTFGIDFSFEF